MKHYNRGPVCPFSWPIAATHVPHCMIQRSKWASATEVVTPGEPSAASQIGRLKASVEDEKRLEASEKVYVAM